MAAVWRNLLRTGAIVSAGIFAGRLAGFARDLVLAYKLGSGPATDLAVYALTLPDVFTNLLVSGALGAALIPEFKIAPDAARSLFLKASAAALVVFGILAAAAAAGGPMLVGLLAPGFPPEAVGPAASLAAMTLIAVPLTAVAAVSTAYLQARDRFVWPALGTLIFNLGLVAAIGGWLRRDNLAAIGWGVVAAAGARWLPQLAQGLALPGPRGSGGRLGPPLLRRYVEALASFGVLVLVSVAVRAFASMDGPGALASVHYAQKVVELPMGVAVGVLGVVLLPRFAELHAAGAEEALLRLARQGVWLVWTIALPATLALGWYSRPVVHALLRHGELSAGQADLISGLTALSVLGLPAQGLCVLLFALLAARRDTASPLKAGLVLLVLYLGASWLGRRWLGLQGVVAAGVLFQWALAAAYFAILKRSHGFALLAAPLRRDLLVALAAAAAGFVPVAALLGRSVGPWIGAAAAAAGGLLSLVAALAPRYRMLPDGFRTFTKASTS